MSQLRETNQQLYPSPMSLFLCLLELLGNGSNLLHSVLVGGQVTLKGLMLPHQSTDLHQRGRLVVLLHQQLLFSCEEQNNKKIVPLAYKHANISRVKSIVHHLGSLVFKLPQDHNGVFRVFL